MAANGINSANAQLGLLPLTVNSFFFNFKFTLSHITFFICAKYIVVLLLVLLTVARNTTASAITDSLKRTREKRI